MPRRPRQRPQETAESARSTTKPVVAYISMNLHEDGGFTVKTSETLRGCASMSDAQRLQRQLVKAHRMHVSIYSQVKPSLQKRRHERRHKGTAATSNGDTGPDGQLELMSTLDQTTMEEPSSPQVDDDEDVYMRAPTTPTTISHSFRIEEFSKVTDFLTCRLAHAQQHSVKRLAKAWIRGICPRKQALYPYAARGVVPGWWPDPKQCSWKEPDHIRKDERLKLCLHILRLRPKYGEMQEWNAGDQRMPHATYDTGGWTKFLREIAPPDCVRDMRETEEVNDRRVNYVKELYDIMQMEEDYLNDAIDGTDQFFWLENRIDSVIEARSNAAKHPSGSRGEIDVTSVQSEPAGDEQITQEGKETEIDAGRTKSKKIRANKPSKSVKKKSPASSEENSSSQQDETNIETRDRTATPLVAVEKPRKRKHNDDNSKPKKRTRKRTKVSKTTTDNDDDVAAEATVSSASTSFDTTSTALSVRPFWPTWTARSDSMMTESDDMMNTSFSSASTSFCPTSTTDSFSAEAGRFRPLAMSMTATPMPALPLSHDTSAISAHMLNNLPQPYFRTVPNSPILPHPSLLGIQMDHSAAITHSMQPHPWVTSSWPTSFASTLYDMDLATTCSEQQPTSQAMVRHSSGLLYNPATTPHYEKWPNNSSFYNCFPAK